MIPDVHRTDLDAAGRRRGAARRPLEGRVERRDVYDDEAAEHWAEEEMLHEALSHWEAGRGKTQPGRERRYDWSDSSPGRDLMTEKELFVLELEEKLKSEPTRRRAKRGRARKRSQNNRVQ